MKVAISSFNFSPGYVSHVIAYAKLFEANGYAIVLWLHKDYVDLMFAEQSRILSYPDR